MEKRQNVRQDKKFIPITSITSRAGEEVANDVFFYTDQIVNIVFLGYPDENDWILVDAGLPFAAEEIIEAAEKRFGAMNQPAYIMLTHGHFDHVGGLDELLKKWDVPVYAHPLEHPFLTGEKSYPKPDPTVEGGLLAKISPLYPTAPNDLGDAIQSLPEDKHVPLLDNWEWIHTPGHTPGHISLFRKDDAILLSGDACITVRQDSFYYVFMQTPEINGPPRYLTTDWQTAKESVQRLVHLQPEVIVPGHGPVMEGKELQKGLNQLVNEFERVAVPKFGKYVDRSSEEKYH